MHSMKTRREFLANYEIIETDAIGQRLAAFLNAAALRMPLVFFDRCTVAKLVYGLSRKPDIDDDHVRKHLPAAVRSARPILEAVYRRYYVSGKQGMRATVDQTDAAQTVLRDARNRAKKSVDRCGELHSRIDASKVRGRDLKNEVMASQKLVHGLLGIAARLPQLPPTRSSEDE